MSQNHKHVATALEHVSAVRASSDAVKDLYARPYSADRAEKIAGAHQAIREGSKLAEVHALIAIAEALEAIASERVTGSRKDVLL